MPSSHAHSEGLTWHRPKVNIIPDDVSERLQVAPARVRENFSYVDRHFPCKSACAHLHMLLVKTEPDEGIAAPRVVAEQSYEDDYARLMDSKSGGAWKRAAQVSQTEVDSGVGNKQNLKGPLSLPAGTISTWISQLAEHSTSRNDVTSARTRPDTFLKPAIEYT